MVDDILATANGVGGQAPTGASVNAAMAGGLPLTGTVRESVERADELTAGRRADIQQGIDDRLQDAVDAHGEGVAAQHVANHPAIQAESAARHDRAEEGFAEFEQRQDRMAVEHRHPFVEEVDGATDAAKDYMREKLREALGGLLNDESSSDGDPKD